MPAADLRKRLRAAIGRNTVRTILRALVRWNPAPVWQDGYSIILGIPWHLRHLLHTNLQFVAKQHLDDLRAIHCVLDRVEPEESARLEESAKRQFPDLPLQFHCYRGLAGHLVQRADISTFYNAMNCSIALRAINTRIAILHDFDLYPLVPDYFARVHEQMRRQSLQFCGTEFTLFDGLTQDDQIIGTWCLGMDVEWLRRHCSLIDIFHAIQKIRGRWITLDPFSQIQFNRKPRRTLVDQQAADDFCHVRNLCSSYLRFSTGRPVKIAWKLHYLWYLEYVEGVRSLPSVTEAMHHAVRGNLQIDGRSVPFAGIDPTCANVLETELVRMERALFGRVRPEVAEYISGFREFLTIALNPTGARLEAAGTR